MKARQADLWRSDADPAKDDPLVQFKLDGSRDSLPQESFEYLRDAVIRAAEEIGLQLKDGVPPGGDHEQA
jgi:hypothetical protein